MRRILHLLALLALVLVGSGLELRLEASAEPISCCCGSTRDCGMPPRGPGQSSCPTQTLVDLTASPSVCAPQQASPSEVRREPRPWPPSLTGAARMPMAGSHQPIAPAIAPSPPERLALLSTFRI